MANVVGDIAVSVGADIAPLQKELKRGSTAVKGFGGDFQKMGKRIAKVGAAVAGTMALIAAAMVKAGANASKTARKIDNLARTANAGVVDFQKMAAATRTVGISQEKLSDILKDVTERVGDFIATGGGPMKDFFENIAPLVGVTADQFARLSGPEALQLYFNSLEQANLSQAKMTFYLEAMASDATALIPLLQNNGRAIKEIGNEAERTGRILDEEMVAAGVELDRVLGDASDTIRQSFNTAILKNKDAIAAMANFVSTKLIPALAEVTRVIGKIAEAAAKASKAIAEMLGLADMPTTTTGNVGGIVTDPSEVDPFEDNTGKGQGGTGLSLDLFPGGEVIPAPRNRPANLKILETESSTQTTNRLGGGGSSYSKEDLERLKASLLSEREQMQAHYEDSMEKLREFRENKLATEEEYNQLERELKDQHQNDLAELERRQMAARLQMVSGALGDLSSLMQTNSKKLFQIGKAAAVAEAVVSGYQAAVDAWQKGMKIGGPPVAAAFTAASLAKTGALISGIQSQTIGGGGGGQAVGGGGVAAATATQSPEAQVVNVQGLDPTQLYTGQALIDIFDGLADVARDRGVRFVVT